MGCGASTPISAESKEIDRQLREASLRKRRELKLLLLGTGGSGKSTIAKQMKVIHLNGYTDTEKTLYTEFVHLNIYQGFKALVRAMDELKRYPADELLGLCDQLRTLTVHHGNIEMTESMGRQLEQLWADPVVKEVWKKSPVARQEESAIYFFENLARCCASGYVPSLEDVLHVRIKTTGIKEISFAFKGFTFRVVDVGGQRSERRKWIHCFQDVTAVLYVVSLADYDLTMEEDPTTNRLTESLDLFNKVVNNAFFVNVDVVLFLNKKDVFRQKIVATPITECFREWPANKDPHSYDAAVSYLSGKFAEANAGKTRKIYTHETCATDTSNVQVVWNAVHEVLIRESVTEAGFDAGF